MQILKRQLIVVIAMCFIANDLTAAQIHLYTNKELMDAKRVYEPNIRGIFREDLIRQLPAADRGVLAKVILRIPLRGEHPLQYTARPLDRSIIVPMMSMKFLDELTIAWAWFEENGCQTAYLTSYLSSLLGFNSIHVGPMKAFNLSMAVTKNKRVNSLSLKLSKSALFFLLAHEAGHIVRNHQAHTKGLKSQAQEQAADEYALFAMARIGVMPAGMLQYFMAAYMFEPLPDLQTWEYKADVIGELTHPLTSKRVRLIANSLAANPMGYAHSELNPVNAAQQVKNVAAMISEIANHMDHGGMKLYSASWLREHFPEKNFYNACPIK